MAKSTAPRATASTRKNSIPPAPAAVAAPAEPTYEQIAERAYGLWLSRGAPDGDAFSDWLRAESELRSKNWARARSRRSGARGADCPTTGSS
jgi:hypothetical protein